MKQKSKILEVLNVSILLLIECDPVVNQTTAEGNMC